MNQPAGTNHQPYLHTAIQQNAECRMQNAEYRLQLQLGYSCMQFRIENLLEPRTSNLEPRTACLEPRTSILKPRTSNPPRCEPVNREPETRLNQEPNSGNSLLSPLLSSPVLLSVCSGFGFGHSALGCGIDGPTGRHGRTR